MVLAGDYSAFQQFSVAEIAGIDNIDLTGGHSYNLSANKTVAAGQTLTVDASGLTSGDTAIFSGSFVISGSLNFIGGPGTDTFTGGANNDTFNMGANLTAADAITGGGGNDTMTLNGDYSTGLVLDVTGVLTISLAAGNSYNFTTQANLTTGLSNVTVDGSALTSSDSLSFDGSPETGALTLNGGAGNDTLTGGTGGNTFVGGGGADTLTGGSGGANNYVYNAVSDSTGTGYDTIVDFNAPTDFFTLPTAITSIDTPVVGSLSTASFDSDLSSALNAAVLNANSAVLFTANSGTLSGQTFLVVDATNTAGYQANTDYVMNLTSANLPSFGTANFHS